MNLRNGQLSEMRSAIGKSAFIGVDFSDHHRLPRESEILLCFLHKFLILTD
jgi:hypothetical protein